MTVSHQYTEYTSSSVSVRFFLFKNSSLFSPRQAGAAVFAHLCLSKGVDSSVHAPRAGEQLILDEEDPQRTETVCQPKLLLST